jgi:hypothetical protein
MAGNGRRCRSRWDNAADVAQTVRAAALSPQDLMSRHAKRAAHSFAQARRGMKEAVAAPPTVECGSGRRMGANRALVAKSAPDGFSESLARFRADGLPQPASRLSGES